MTTLQQTSSSSSESPKSPVGLSGDCRLQAAASQGHPGHKDSGDAGEGGRCSGCSAITTQSGDSSENSGAGSQEESPWSDIISKYLHGTAESQMVDHHDLLTSSRRSARSSSSRSQPSTSASALGKQKSKGKKSLKLINLFLPRVCRLLNSNAICLFRLANS